MNAISSELEEDCCSPTDEFVRFYYSVLNKPSHEKIVDIYLESATLSWNILGIGGRDRIEDFLLKLPTRIYNPLKINSYSVEESASGASIKMLVMITGVVKYSEQVQRDFRQNLVLILVDDKWKITTDYYRDEEEVQKTASEEKAKPE